MSTVMRPSASSVGSIMPDMVSTLIARLLGQALVGDELDECARTVAALFDFAAVAL